MNALNVQNLDFCYDNLCVFKRFNLQIKKGLYSTIIGPGGSGKSTLFKILCGNLKFDGSVLIFNKSIEYNLKRNYIGIVSSDYNNFKYKKVIDEIIYYLKVKGIADSKFDSEIKKICKKTGIKKILNFDISDLSIKYKILFLVSIQLINKPKLLIIDNIFYYFGRDKEQIVKLIKSLQRKNTNIINITNNPEDVFYGDEIIILGESLVQGSILDIVDEDIFLKNNLVVPFVASLSSKLKFYGLIDENYYDVEKLVDVLWD